MQFLSMGFLFLMVLEGYGTEETDGSETGIRKKPGIRKESGIKKHMHWNHGSDGGILVFHDPACRFVSGDNELAGKIYPYYTRRI